MSKPDLVIRGGTVVDGTGSPGFEADVVIEGDRIASVGRYGGNAAEVIDARGKLVTPGFVDIHTHLDAQLTWDPLGAPSNLHGVTSVVVGNCGVGFAPCRPKDRDYLMFLMEGVEDIPQRALQAGLEWNWETFPQYLDALALRPLGLNVGAHLSHAPLRIYAMGERGATDAAASDEELALMRHSVLEAMAAGALGVSTGRTTMHRTPAWDPVPGTFADSRELAALTGALKEFGAGVFELVPYGGAGEDAGGLAKEYEWMIPLAQQSGRPFSLALVQNVGYPDAWRDAIERAGAAADQGARIIPQTAVRSVGILFGCGLAISPLSLFPAAGELLEKSVEEQRRMLRDPAVQARLRHSIAETSGTILGGMSTIDDLYPLEDIGALAYETSPERSVAGIARRQGKRPLDVVLDLLLEHDLRNFFMIPLFNFDLEAAGEMLRDARTTIGLGDSGAHTTQTSDSGFPTFVLSYWVRHRRLLTIEAAVKKLTSDLAHLWGIRDRGVLAHGAFADVNVIDFDDVDLEAPQLRHDFPAGAPHLHQGAHGYAATVINGRVLMRDGAHSGVFPGRVLRNPKCP